MQIELVQWRDAGNDDLGWESPDETVDVEHIITSVGYVVKETENYLTLAMDLHSDGSTNTRGRIPKGMIISRKILSKS